MNINYNRPFSDWLSISHATSQTPKNEVLSLIGKHTTFEYFDLGAGKEAYKSEHGSIRITLSKTSTNLSFSGRILSLLRDVGAMNDFVMALGSSPYNITRLDAAYDVPIAGHLVLQGIRRLYPDGVAMMSGRPRLLQYVLTPLDSKTDTGTCYFQNKTYSGHQFLRVYDKAYEVLCRTGERIPPTTRYELTAKRGASLRDLVDPTNILFHYVPEELLKPAKGIHAGAWKPINRVSYDESPQYSFTDYQKLKSLIESHPALDSILKQSASVHGGPELLLRFIHQRFLSNGVAMQRSGDSNELEKGNYVPSEIT